MKLEVSRARPDDNGDILSLLSTIPQPGAISLSFERSPNYFHGAAISAEDPEVFILRTPEPKAQSTLGIFNIGTRRLFINGELQRVRYLHDLRLDPSVRGTRALGMAFQTTREMMADDELFQAVVLEENHSFLATMMRPRKLMPDLSAKGSIETSLIYGRASRKFQAPSVEIRPATPEDLPAMQALLDEEGPKRQYFHYHDLNELKDPGPWYRALSVSDYYLIFEDGELAGLAGTWDQKPFKQTRVAAYSKPVRLGRPLYNMWAKATRGMPLPKVGGCLSYLTLHTVVIRNHDINLLRMLVNALLQGPARDYDAIACGFFTADPLSHGPRSFPRRTLLSHHFIGTWGREHRPWIDPKRIPHADIARL
ncbi:hypothetical protein ACFOZ5_03995 [Marinobacter lacisalsi]|uniref:N-acetyltransferase domain-containing protein n=1 Tax=Marinobacter lacisalsi TaxID=475979 RepID=A0ABV8QCU4_9GAMM